MQKTGTDKKKQTTQLSPFQIKMAELNAKFKVHKENPMMEKILKAAKQYIAEKEANES
ncbi:hypothetical protein MTBBW1_1300033 [Desulfamplus magnetovallimortis]|uniref:Uncharacterized protein n=1 Tax=Desulfamplus magnetovallimortis TaxID=1246637 RepID=A0A1W1H759_9BACT|nr:hypothetical protein [Desulfamplus magnetovallimortis]SLM28293.1 hypothetical protein MTBBW1_1300033 [Desulfamplus magnetovallimortis]